MATHSSTLAWRIPWTEGPGGLQSVGSQSQSTRAHRPYKPTLWLGDWFFISPNTSPDPHHPEPPTAEDSVIFSQLLVF